MRTSRRGAAVASTLAVAACVLAACSGGTPEPAPTLVRGHGEREVVAVSDAAASDGVVAATWRAGLAALDGSDGNAVVSPASLVVALSMLAEGASGASADALGAALGASGDDRTRAVAALTGELARFEGDPALVRAKDLPPTPMVHLANQVVVDDGVTPAQAYLDRLATGYGAGLLVTDLASEKGTAALDPWVREHTGGLVERSAIAPDPALVLVLQNAVTLAAAWFTPFEPAMTKDEPFTLGDGSQVDVSTMHTALDTAYAELDGWRAVRLPYLGPDGPTTLWADVLLPPESSAAAGDPATADASTVAALCAALDDAQAVRVVLSLPRLDLATTTDLRPTLERVGLDGLLSPATAGLDGLLVDPPQPPFVGQAVQQAVLTMDEEGTRAAAVTEIAVAAGAAPADRPVVLDVDRPYLVAIEDGATGWPVFLAAVVDPRG